MYNKSFDINDLMINKKKLPVLVLKKTNSNFFACLYKKKMLFSLSFYSFIKKNTKNAYRLFWFRLFKYIEVRLFKYKIKKINLIIYGKLLLKYKILLRNKVFMKKLNFFYYYTGIAHNGCKLKKKRRK